MKVATPSPLRLAIFTSGLRQVEIAKRARIHEPRLSKIANGYLVATEDEQRRIARVLRCSIDQLFPEAMAS